MNEATAREIIKTSPGTWNIEQIAYANGWLDANTAAQEREAKLTAETDRLQAEIERLRKLVNPECEKAHTEIEAENAKLRGVVERLRKALAYCAVDPGLLQPEHNRQCAVAQNALAESADTLGGK